VNIAVRIVLENNKANQCRQKATEQAETVTLTTKSALIWQGVSSIALD